LIHHDLGIGEIVSCILGDTDGERSIDSLCLGHQLLSDLAYGEITNVDGVLGPQHKVDIALCDRYRTAVHQCGRRQVSVNDIAWIAVNRQDTLWSTALYRSDAQQLAGVASGGSKLTSCLCGNEPDEEDKSGSACAPTEFASS